MKRLLLVLLLLTIASYANADIKKLRWTAKEDSNGQFDHVLQIVNKAAGISLTTADFYLIENRNLANNHFKMYIQQAGGYPIRGLSIRTWTSLQDDNVLVQGEAAVESKTVYTSILSQMQFSLGQLSYDFGSGAAMSALRNVLITKADRQMRAIESHDMWVKHEPVRAFKVKSKNGTHYVDISLINSKVVNYRYEEFPQADVNLEVQAQVYPIYELAGHSKRVMERVPVILKYLKSQATKVTEDPYKIMRSRRYFEGQYDPVLGETEAGRNQGFWSMNYLKTQAQLIRQGIAPSPNDFEHGLILEGQYATVNLHPDVTAKYHGINFTPGVSAQFKPTWTESQVSGHNTYEMIPMGALLGRPLTNPQEAYDRPARILPDQDPVGYLNDGFDEIQVYYAVNTLMESLRTMGFSDPELSTRPFNAFLYDPDISMKDNAFYTDDTINFTTYSPGSQNMARDNSTIWHELGHGIMDRLMGDFIQLADTGGLSEGMADFVAALVIADVTNGVPFEGYRDFRIINNTGFHLTNEVHDDGEAYGGSMKDLLDASVKVYGHDGVVKVADLTMETMRLCRNNPALTAEEWFSHMLFADELGQSGIRLPGEMSALILKALNGRNFNLNGSPTADFTLMNNAKAVTSSGPGSRKAPIPVTLSAEQKATYHLSFSLKSSENYKFQYPVDVRVALRGGAIQGAIKWEGESDQPAIIKLHNDGEVANFDLTATGTCDFVNREDGSCVDYAYVQVFNPGGAKPVAKKRFYVQVHPAH